MVEASGLVSGLVFYGRRVFPKHPKTNVEDQQVTERARCRRLGWPSTACEAMTRTKLEVNLKRVSHSQVGETFERC